MAINQRNSSRLAAFGLGIVISLIGLPFAFIGYINFFNPSPNATINVNGVDVHPGNPSFTNAAMIFLTIGGIFLFIGLFIIILGLMGKTKRFSTFRTSSMYNQVPFTPFKIQSTTNYQNNSNSQQYAQQSNGFSDQSNSPPFSQSYSNSSSFANPSTSQITCSACGAMNKASDQFCSNCGKRLT